MNTTNLDKTLDWEIEQEHIYDIEGEPILGYKAIKNNKSGELLQIAKHSYTPISNAQLLEKAGLIMDATGFQLEGFSSFNGGRKVLAYLHNPESRNMVGLLNKNYMILGNSHDASTSFFSGLTNYVFRCQNMFSQTNRQLRVMHTSDAENRLDDLVDTIDLYYDAEKEIYQQMEDFERVKVDGKSKELLVENLLDFNMSEWNEVSTRKRNVADRLFESIETETLALGNNLFGLFNGVTHYTTHVLKSKNKVFGSPFGHAAQMNRKAIEWCREQAVENRTIQIGMF